MRLKLSLTNQPAASLIRETIIDCDAREDSTYVYGVEFKFKQPVFLNQGDELKMNYTLRFEDDSFKDQGTGI